MSHLKFRRGAMIASLLCAAAIAGCASPPEGRTGPGQRLDPWEKTNRKIFNFNEDVDRVVLRPVATVYSDIVPRPIRRGVSNFFANFSDAWSAVNNMLQGKFQLGFDDATRVGANTLFGLLGVLDVASEMGLERHHEDFGQTLGHYGVGAGAYIVLPILGPSTVRDTAAMPLDRLVSPPVVINGAANQIGLTVLQIVNARAGLLGATRVIDDIALDKYTFVRDAYLQRRRSLLFDGDPPDIKEPAGDNPTGAASAEGAASPPPRPAPAASGAASTPAR